MFDNVIRTEISFTGSKELHGPVYVAQCFKNKWTSTQVAIFFLYMLKSLGKAKNILSDCLVTENQKSIGNAAIF